MISAPHHSSVFGPTAVRSQTVDTKTMITVKDLTKRYARTIAVDQISFEVAKGQIVGFLGPNGAGKTTTMRVLTCFLPPTSGKANIAGYDRSEEHTSELQSPY